MGAGSYKISFSCWQNTQVQQTSNIDEIFMKTSMYYSISYINTYEIPINLITLTTKGMIHYVTIALAIFLLLNKLIFTC